MTRSICLERRQTCEKILNEHQSWALDKNEFEIENDLKFILESKKNAEVFTIYSILNSKLKLFD
jgi:hypothetical protein